jgi:hypothetical protein
MGLTCRFLGHTFGDSEIEHTREERGNEVVATVKKTRTCKRCNIEQVISQNKEVTSIRPTETPETNLSDNTETDASSDGWESAPDHEHVRADDSVETTQDDSPVNDAVILNNESTEQDEAQWPTDIETPPHDAGKPTAGEQTGESVQKKHDDTGAEILDSDTDTNTDPHSERRPRITIIRHHQPVLEKNGHQADAILSMEKVWHLRHRGQTHQTRMKDILHDQIPTACQSSLVVRG